MKHASLKTKVECYFRFCIKMKEAWMTSFGSTHCILLTKENNSNSMIIIIKLKVILYFDIVFSPLHKL